MKRIITVSLIVLGVLQVGTIVYLAWMKTDSPRLAYIDTAKLLNEYKGMQEARKVYRNQAQTWQSNIDTLAIELEQMIVAHEKEIPGMTKREQELSEQVIRGKQTELQQYQEAVKAKAREADNKMTSDVLAEVNAFLDRYGKENGYTIILAATSSGNIAFARKEYDLTNHITTMLNEKYAAK